MGNGGRKGKNTPAQADGLKIACMATSKAGKLYN
jgi:hypothetical protein